MCLYIHRERGSQDVEMEGGERGIKNRAEGDIEESQVAKQDSSADDKPDTSK
jgi:hypothetical protein